MLTVRDVSRIVGQNEQGLRRRIYDLLGILTDEELLIVALQAYRRGNPGISRRAILILAERCREW